MEIKEITRLAIQIEKLHNDRNYEDLSCLLTDISNTHVTLEQLQSTNIAKSIYQLVKSCPVAWVRKSGKDVLSKWRRLYSSRHRHTNNKDTSQTKACEAAERDTEHTSDQDGDQKADDNERNKEACFKVEDRNEDRESSDLSYVRDALLNSSTNSPVLRNKCVELLIQALNPDPPDPELTNQLAHAIETHIDAIHCHNPPKYKSCIRSKVANLKNPKNPHLRQGLLTGLLAPEVFARMSAQEMAGDELRQLRQGYTAAGISEHQLPQGPEGTVTAKVRCQRCDGMDCRVTQISRGTLFLPSWVKRGSADEEAMTFMTCATCGAQWYHNRWVCL